MSETKFKAGLVIASESRAVRAIASTSGLNCFRYDHNIEAITIRQTEIAYQNIETSLPDQRHRVSHSCSR